MSTKPASIETYRAPDGQSLTLRHFPPAVEPIGSVVLLHGIISHSGWYGASAEFLAQRGFDVYALDRRGSGLNMDQRGDVDSWRTWVADIVAMCEQRRQHGPVVLLGISWGGKLAPVIARERPDLLAGIGLICPGVYALQQPGLAKRSALSASGKLGIHQRRVTIPLEDPALFTNSPKWQAFVRDDPLTLREITMRFAREDHKMTRFSRQSPQFIHTPTLLVLAGRDRIVRNQRTRRYLTEFASQDKTLLEYQTAAHTLEFEPDPSMFYDDLAAWVARVMHRQKV
ncbi:lysophospholipase [Aeoliella sp. ICT_H6.2]|uniref:Lysophospholipase n=1 Tax=Aeoliella straminimaris TaxID=2954799 RepID=A0A9X2JFD4_9BACT|nr:alpha/beta fold hydrolase [Aeoliella straminimaris]MCO6043900.1 lysophospholipase [Aeoliella straminimaris]